jgi:iron complex transport system ATP-binding protein
MTAGRLEVEGITVRLGHAQILDGVDLVAEPGSWTAVVGPNGAGKSTLLRVLAGLVRHSGRIALDGQDLDRLTPRRRAAAIGYAPQTPVLPEALSVTDYVQLGRTPYHSLLAGPRDADRTVVAGSLELLDLVDLSERPLRTLSGGERQRAVLARALAQQPRLLLLDEPTSSLDLGHAQQLLELVDRLRRDQGVTVVSSLHDLTLAGQYAGRLVLLANGRTVASGSADQVLTAQTLARYYGASAEVLTGPDGVLVQPVRPTAERPAERSMGRA